MANLVIVNACGFGRELLSWVLGAPECGLTPKGFLDDKERPGVGEIPVLGTVAEYAPEADDVFLIAEQTPATRSRVASQLHKRGCRFATFVHPTALVGHGTTIGAGSILLPYCVVSVDVTIGEHVLLNPHATVGPGAKLGDASSIGSHCDITPGVQIGQGSLIGSNASVMPGITVGAFAVIGAGSAVIRPVPDLATVVGVPAKKIFGYEPIVDENWQPED